MNLEVIRVKRRDFLFYFILVDALFFPYIRKFHALSSTIVLMVWFLKNAKEITRKKIFLIAMSYLLFMVISVLIGWGYTPTYLYFDFINFIMNIFYILYYIYFFHEIKQRHYQLDKIFALYIVVVFVFSILFFKAPQKYFDIRTFWTMSGRTITYVDKYFSRFTFLQSDPNSIGCIIISILMYLLITKRNKLSLLKKIVLTGMVAFSCMTTLSTTSFVVFSLSFILYFVFYILPTCNIKVNKRNFVVIISTFIILLIGAIICFKSTSIGDTLFATAKLRIGNNLREGTMSGRTVIWKKTLVNFNWFKYILFGRGIGVVGNDGNGFLGHNGHFHIILYYGFIAYFLFLFLYFRKPKYIRWRKYIIILPLFLLFTVNVLIVDFRAGVAMAIISAAFYTNCEGHKCNSLIREEVNCLKI